MFQGVGSFTGLPSGAGRGLLGCLLVFTRDCGGGAHPGVEDVLAPAMVGEEGVRPFDSVTL
jgi:hypothetical protein